MTTAISMRALSKRYTVEEDHAATLKEALLRLFRPTVRHEIEALKPLTLNIEQGETFGIVGQNGAGKSTTLKLIAGVTAPTSGAVEVNGSLMSLIELGAGFQPDLSGVENIYLNGSILGMSEERIGALLPSIVEFAGLEKFIFTPVKHYSSGMAMRLGFSIAAHLDPDIIVLDENLAVGDICFQAKCLAKLRELKRRGRTIVLVTHCLDVAEELCDRVAWLDHGGLVSIGAPGATVKRYEHAITGGAQREWTNDISEQSKVVLTSGRFGSDDAVIHDCSLLGADGTARHVFAEGEPLSIALAFETRRAIEDLAANIYLSREDYVTILGVCAPLDGMGLPLGPGKGIARYEIDDLRLGPGRYIFSASLSTKNGQSHYDLHMWLYHFRVEPRFPAQLVSVVRLPCEIQVLTASPAKSIVE